MTDDSKVLASPPSVTKACIWSIILELMCFLPSKRLEAGKGGIGRFGRVGCCRFSKTRLLLEKMAGKSW